MQLVLYLKKKEKKKIKSMDEWRKADSYQAQNVLP